MSDYISRTQAIDAIGEKSDEIYKIKQKGATYPHDAFFQGMAYAENVVKQLPSAQPEIIYCKDCVKHNKGLGNYEVHPDGSGTWIWKDSACPLVSWRDKAQGHEFDYQFCAYAERREVTE